MLDQSNLNFLPPIKSNEFLPQISRWTTWGGLMMVGTCSLSLALAATIKFPIAIKADGTVRPLGELKLVQATSSGIIQNILISENQSVQTGQAIATINNSSLQLQKNQLQQDLKQDQVLSQEINYQINVLDTQILAEIQLIERIVASARANLSLNQREYRDRQIITQTEMQEAQATLELAKEEMNRYRQLANTGSISQLQVKEKEQAFQAAQAKVERAKAALNPISASIEIATEKIAAEKARGEATLATLNQEKQNLRERKIAIQNRVILKTNQLQQNQIELNQTSIVAPTDGKILELKLRNPRQFVKAGEAIATIAPSNASLIIKARVAAREISNLKICQATKVAECSEGQVQLRISAYPYPDYGILQAGVKAIAPDTTTKDTDPIDPYYEVTIEPERSYLIRGKNKYPLQAGMEVTAEIMSREETMLGFILRKARLLTNL